MDNVLILIDIQKEYNTPGRLFYLKGIDESLGQAKKILHYARKEKWRIFHVKHNQPGALFSPDNPYSEFIAGFEPAENEKVFIKNNYSCFSNEAFAGELEKHKNTCLYIAGYGSSMCCLATIVEGQARGYKFQFISDASLAKAAEGKPETEMHKYAVIILSTFAVITTADKIISQ